MFSKKIVPDFTPRRVISHTPVIASAPPQPEEALPERILISESTKPPPVKAQPPASIYSHSLVVPPPPLVKVAATQRSLPDPVSTFTGFKGGFSPNLETFPTLNKSYFSPGAGVNADQWSRYRALQNVDLSGYALINASYISTASVYTNDLVTSNISTSTISADTIRTNNLYTTLLSTTNLYANSTFSPFINTSTLDLDGNILTTAGNELLYNGQPIATVSSISTNVAAWALYPATSTIIADSNDIIGVKNIQLSTINGQPFTTQSSVSTWSQFPATSEVNFAQYNLNNVSTINGSPYITGSASAWSAFPATQTVNMSANSLNNVAAVNLSNTGTQAILTAGAGNVLNVNGVPVSGGSASAWATFPATSNVTIPDKDLVMTTTTPGVGYNTANLNANVVIGNTGQAPLRPDLTAYCGTVSLGGLANPLTAMNVYSLGSVGINSASGISIAGGGGVSVAGAGGVSITGAGALALNGGNVEVGGAGGVFVNGTGAITVTAGGVFVNGGGVAVSAGGCAITAGGLSVAGGAVTIGTAGLAGGDLTIYGGDLRMSAVGGSTKSIITDKIASVGSNTLAITGLSTINGLPYSTGSATAFSYNIYVSNASGSDTTGDGKISNPFQTITKAITVAGTIPETNQVIIVLACGTYTENLNITRDNLYITGGSTSLSTSTILNGSITVDTTGSSQLVLVGGLSSLVFTNLIYNNANPKNQSYVVTDCVINPGAGVSAIVFTDTSVGGNGDMTIQNSLIYMSDTTAVTISNGRISMVNTQVTNSPFLANATVSMITTSGTGGFNLFGCSITQGSTSSAVQPLINMTNNASTGAPMLINSCILQYTSATADTGTGAKCCIRFANSAAISNVSVINNLLICEGARTTNGVPTQYLAIQRTGAGTITLSYGQNLCGATANHLPATSAGLTKTPYILLGN